MNLSLICSRQSITRSDHEYVVADSRNYLNAEFSFSEEWEGLVKTAIFKNGETVKHVVLDDDKCLVPWEVIKTGVLEISVFGGDLITANVAEVRIHQSGYEEGTAPEDPTPTVYEQIIKMLQDIEKKEIDPEDVEKIIKEYLDEHPIESITADQCRDIVRAYVTEHKAEFKGDTGERGPAGPAGEAGYTPVKGVDYFDGAPGPAGERGPAGEAGYTPVKGVDYFDGERGPAGPAGERGPAGADGHTPTAGEVANVVKDIADGTTVYVGDDDKLHARSGGGGSTVSVQPTLESGVEIGRITVDGEESVLYAPQGSGGSANIEKYVLIDEVKFSSGLYIDKQGNVVSSANAGQYEKKVVTTQIADAVPVVGGAKYRFTFGSKAASQVAQHGAWLDSSNNVIGLIFSRNGSIDKQVVEAPANAVKAVLSAWIGGRSYMEKIEPISEAELNNITYETEKQALLSAMREHQQKDWSISTPAFAPFKKGYVTIINDDMRGQADEMYQICHARGIPLSIAAIIHEQGLTTLNETGRPYYEVFRDIVADGGEILAHHGDQMTQAMIEDYDTCYEHFKTTKERLQKYGFDVNGCILAGGTGQVVGSPITDMWVRYFYQYSDLYGVPSYGYPYYGYRTALSNHTLESAKQKIDEAVQNKTWVRFYLHMWDDFSKADFTALMDYIASYDDDLLGKVTYKDVYDEHIIYKTKKPRVLSVEVGNHIYNDGITINSATLHYSDGSTEEVTAGVTMDYSKVNIAVPGWYPVSVTYAGLTCTAPCRVVGSERSIIAEGAFGSGNVGTYTVWSDGLLQIKNNATYKTGMGTVESVADIPWASVMGSISSFDPDTSGENGQPFNTYLAHMFEGSGLRHFDQTINKIKEYMFKGCTNLKSLRIMGDKPLGSRYDTTPFEDCPNFDTLVFTTYGANNSRYQYTLDSVPDTIRNIYVGGSAAPQANWFGSMPNRDKVTDIYVEWSESAEQNADKGSNNWGLGSQATVHYGVTFTPEA